MDECKCRYCSMKPVFWQNGMLDIYASTDVLAFGLMDETALVMGKDANNEMVIYAMGPGETEAYYPKYCPECGRDLRRSRQAAEPH